MYRRDPPDFEKLYAYSDSLVTTIEKNNLAKAFPDKYILGLNRRADALFSKGLYTEAYDDYFKAIKLAKETDDFCSLSNYSHSLGMALYRQQKYLEAAKSFNESYIEAAGCPNDFTTFYHRQELLDNIGLCYTHAHQYDSAMGYYAKALQLIAENQNKFNKEEKLYITAKAVIIGNMADVYVAVGKTDTAIELLKQSIAINIKKGHVNSDALTDHVKLANLYLSTGNNTELLPALKLIKAELDSIPDKTANLNWHKMMWRYYDLEKDWVNAYKYLFLYEQLKDSFLVNNKALMSTDFEGKIRSMEKQYQIATLNKNSKYAKIFSYIAALIAVMAIIIIVLIWRNAQRARKNIEELKQLNNQVNEQKEKLLLALNELEIRDKDKTRILRSVAHDVMNPIAAIMALTDILKVELTDLSEENDSILKLIKEACANSLSLSRDILEAAIKIDKSKLTKEWINIHQLVTSCTDLLQLSAAAKKQSIIVQSPETNIEAKINKEKIWRILNNLIANAIKFSHKNTHITISITTTDTTVQISVKDNGIGISEKNKPLVFDMFTEAKNPGTAGEVPHGLGLSISLQFARAHNGNIWLESTEGKGTTFHLVLPLNDSD
jgi:signal transduction histidine kinase